jgi:succinate dehydrogenase/fumarate reductase flavoprotein subunit
MYEATTPDKAKWSFQVPPAPPAEEEIVETVRCDAVVVGGGIGGFSAAVRLRELGADVVLIEKSASYSGRGGHFGVADSKLMEEKGVRNDMKEVARQWILMSGNNVDQELIWLFLNRSREAMDWLIPKTEKANLRARLIDCAYQADPYHEYYGSHAFMPENALRGNHVTRALYEDALRLGVTVRFQTAGTLLIQDERGRVTGLYARSEAGVIRFLTEKGVVLATGDIGGDEEMCRAYAPDALRTLASQYVPAGCNTGDGHKMGLWAGGVMAEEVFPLMMHPQHYAWQNLFYLFVNKDGKRFMNEDCYVQGRATSFMRQPDGIVYSILPGDYMKHVEESLQYGGGLFWGIPRHEYGVDIDTEEGCQHFVKLAFESGNAWQADSIEALADMIDVDKAQFLKTFEEYNGFCRAKDDRQFGKRPELLYPLDKGPYIALRIGVVLLEVVGGLEINTKMQVMKKDRTPIEGLYAIGDTTGGMYGHEYVTTILGNSHGRALTWGYIAAESIMEK